MSESKVNKELQDNTKQFDKLKVKLADADLQFVNKQMERKQRQENILNLVYAEALQHFVALIAKKKNIQWNDDLFAGVMLEEGKDYASILLFKSAEAAAAARSQQPSTTQPSK